MWKLIYYGHGNHVRQRGFNPVLAINMTSMQRTAQICLAIPRNFAIANLHLLSCISFEIQMLHHLEVAFEGKNIL